VYPKKWMLVKDVLRAILAKEAMMKKTWYALSDLAVMYKGRQT
jgi:hypothetical protein